MRALRVPFIPWHSSEHVAGAWRGGDPWAVGRRGIVPPGVLASVWTAVLGCAQQLFSSPGREEGRHGVHGMGTGSQWTPESGKLGTKREVSGSQFSAGEE